VLKQCKSEYRCDTEKSNDKQRQQLDAFDFKTMLTSQFTNGLLKLAPLNYLGAVPVKGWNRVGQARNTHQPGKEAKRRQIYFSQIHNTSCR
jgi:hypothetical protein